MIFYHFPASRAGNFGNANPEIQVLLMERAETLAKTILCQWLAFVKTEVIPWLVSALKYCTLMIYVTRYGLNPPSS